MNGLSLTSDCGFLTKWNVLAIFILDMQSSSLKLFSSFEQKAMLLKRQAFAVFSGELDQYHLYLPLIQGKKGTPPSPPAHTPLVDGHPAQATTGVAHSMLGPDGRVLK